MGSGTWVGKPAYLDTDPLTIQEGQQAIAQAITICQIMARGLGHLHMNLSTPQPFRYDCPRNSPQKDSPRSCRFRPFTNATLAPERMGHRKDQRQPPRLPLPSPDHRFESDRNSLSTALSMSSISDRSEGSWHSQHGRWCGEVGTHVKINLPVFKDEDAKDTITYQSWRWDLTVYWYVGCRDCTLLPYAIQSLQGYPGELVWSFSIEIMLDDMLVILDENYNNVKTLDTPNQELFQLQMVDKETVSDWGVCLSRHLQTLAAYLPDCFPLNE